MSRKTDVSVDLDRIFNEELGGRDSETGRSHIPFEVTTINQKKVVIRFDQGIPNLIIIGALMTYFDVDIDAFSMEGDGNDHWYSEMTMDHDNWIDVTIKLGE